MTKGDSGNLALAVRSIRDDLMSRRIPDPVHFDSQWRICPLMFHYWARWNTQSLSSPRGLRLLDPSNQYLPSPDDTAHPTLLAPGALPNPEHLRFALKGCLAASSCYIIYNAIAWPGISTAVTTCLLTALSTIGSSRQKQFLRITGAIVGGFAPRDGFADLHSSQSRFNRRLCRFFSLLSLPCLPGS